MTASSDLFGFVAGDADCDSSSLDTELRSASCLLVDGNNIGSDVSVKDEEFDDEKLTTAVSEDDITEDERREAMLAAMDVQSPHQQRPGLAMSVEACLARFTDKETLSDANMVTCETCSHAAAEATACNGNDDNNNATANSGDHPSSASSKISSTGRFYFVGIRVVRNKC